MAKFISGRQQQLNVGVSSSTENKTSLQVTGKVGIGTTNADGRSLYVFGDAEVTGVTTANRFSTGPSGVGFNIFDNKITGPSEIIIDPAGVGVNTGSVRIKGDLFVDGTQTVIDSTTIELADFNVGIASTVASNVLLDGAGIGIGSVNIRKTFTYDYSSDSLKSSENFDVSQNKVYKVNEVERLSFNRLQVPHADITGIATAAVFRVTGVSTFDGLVDANGGATIDNVRIGVANDNEIDTSTGNLTIDSAGGNVIIDDNLNVVGVSTLYNTTHDNELIYRSNGQLRIIGGGPQTTRNNILFTNGGGLIIDAGSGETAGLTLKGGGGPVRFTQGRVGIETQTPQSTLDVNGDIRVVGFSTLLGYVNIDNSVNINNDLIVIGLTTLTGYVDINNHVDISNSLNVGGGTTINGYVDINNSVDISQKLNVGSGLTVAGYSDFNDAVDIFNSLNVGGGTTINGYVDINNSVDISQKLNVGSGLTVGGYVDINNSVDISNNLNVVGIVTALRFESNQSGLSNFFAGTQAGGAITAGLVDYNVIIGYQAGYDLNGSSYNVAIGYQSLYSTNNSFATGNVAIGYQSLYSTATSDYLVAIGYRAGYYATDVYNSVFIGAYAASNQNVSGNQNVAIGQYSGYNLSTGYFNTFIGGFNGYTNLVTGYQNVALGNNSLYSISSGYDNVVIGQNAGLNITTGYRNILIGRGAAQNSSSIAGNTIIGYSAGSVSDSGDYNVIIGYESGYNAEDDFGTFIGYRAGYNAIDAYASVYIGAQAGYTASGDTNIGIGWDAMYAHDGGGQYNIALGYQSLYNDGASSNWNIAIGYQAGYGSTNTTGSLNILLGYQAGFNLTSGSSNIILGNYGGDSITSGSSNVVIVGGNGSTVDVPIPTGSNQLVIGSDATAWIYGNSSYNVGLGTTNPTQKLDVVGNIKLSGAIHGPTELIIDPRTVGDNTGSVRIKGDLYVDGTNFIVNSSTIELKDFQVGIASDVATNVLLDGAGIGIGSTNIRKTLTYDYSSDSLKSSEHFDLAVNKTYKINEVEVLRDTQLTIPNAYVSGLGTITQLSGTNLTYTNADIDNAYITAGIVTTIGGTNLSYTIAGINTGFVNTGVVTTIRGTDASYANFYGVAGIVTTLAGTNLTYTTGNLGTGNIVTGVVTTIRGTDASYANFYGVAGIVTTIAGTNLTYTNADIDNAYVTTGIVTTIQGTDASYTNLYVNSGIVTNLVGTSMTYVNAEITNLTINSGVVSAISGTDLTYFNLYAVSGIVTTLAGTNLTYTNADIDNAYISVGIVTTLSGTNLTYTNISNVGGISTLGVTSSTHLTTQQLLVSGLTTFTSGTDNTLGNADTGAIQIDGGLGINKNVTIGSNLYVGGYSEFIGIVTFRGGTINLGDSDTDDVVVGGEFASNLVPTTDNTYDLGLYNKQWRNIYVNGIGDIDELQTNIGVVTTLAGTNLTYTNADIDNAYITSGIITSITNTYLTSGIATITTIYGDFDGELNAPGKSWYVSTNGSDSHTGDNINQPFASLAYAVGIATSGDTIFVGSGTFTEVFPMTVPVGVAIKGAGIRGTFIQPTAGTKQNDCFLMNGETTVEDLSIGNFFEPGYAFKFANNCKTTTRSPYIQRVTVLNKGSVTTTADPYGFDTPHSPPSTYKAGRGVLIDGSVCDVTTLEAAMLFNECTFICPNNNALEMTNGGRSEWVNCFTYFADKGIYAYDGNVGLGSTGYVRLKTSGITTSTSGFPTTNDEVYYLEANSQSGTYVQVGTGLTITRVGHGLTIGDRIFADFTTGTASDGFYRVTGYVGVNTFSVTMAGSATTSGNVSYKEALGFGTITAYNTSSGLSSIRAKGEGLFELPSSRVAKTVTAYGNASLSTAQKQFGTASLALDGNGDYVQVASNTDFEYGTGDFTIELWFYPNNFSTFQVLVDQRISAPDNTAYIDVTPTTGLVRYTVASTTITANTALNVTNWNHIAISRSSGTTRMFINGTLQSSTISDSTNYVTAPLKIGGDYAGNPYWVNGYIDEVRITKGTSRYSATFTPSTSAFNSDGNDKLLLHLDGVTGSTSFTDSSIATQDIRWVRSGVGIATATRITLADYQQFGGDMRSIGSASVFGNTGVTADGPGSTLRLFAFNFGHIGSGKDFTQDVSLVNQAAEVTTTNNGSVYFASIDQSGDFRVGDAFYVNQEAGTVNFGGQDFTITSLSDLNISDGNNTTTITPTTLTVGNVQIFGNDITTTSGDININPSGTSEINIIGNVNISGILTATIAAVDSIQLGDTSITVDDTGSNGTIRFNTDGVESMRITNLQKVGIGSDVPTSKLDVGGDVKVIGVVTATTAFDTTYTKTGSITATTSTTSQTAIHSGLASASYRSIEYLVQATQGTSFHTTKILVVHDGTNAYLTEYGSVYNSVAVATYDVDISGGNLRLLATPASASSTTFKVSFTSIVI